MRIVFGHDLDGGAWPGPLAGVEAAIGVAWAGPAGFVGLLETALGLSGHHADGDRRASLLSPTVASTEGFWSRSAERDLIGTSYRLLAWRDELRTSGWNGKPPGVARLDALATVTADVSPGIPDRLEAIRDALETRSPGIESLELVDPEASFHAAWRRVFEALRARGVTVSAFEVARAQATGDLEASRRDGFKPAGDHTLQLVRPGSTIDAAEHVAAWIAAVDATSSLVVVGSDPVLDRALARFGVPTVGAARPPEQNPLLSVLPLVLELGWRPADPQRAIELLTLRRSPIPAAIGWRLAAALSEWPAVDSDGWRDGLQSYLDRIEDPSGREEAAQLIGSIFRPAADRREEYGADAIHERADLVDGWLSRLSPSSRADAAAIAAAHRQVEEVKRFASNLGSGIAGEPQLIRLLARATASAGASHLFEAQAGINSVARPGAIVGPADIVIWWDFTESSVHRHRTILLSPSEHAALASAGVELPDPGDEARQAALRWSRPFEETSVSLLLVCPRRRPDGDAEFAHPAWDEIVARVNRPDRAAVPAMEVEVPRSVTVPARIECEPRCVPVPVRDVKIPEGLVALRERESASSLGKLVGCNFAYAVAYGARVSSGLAARVPSPDSALLRGKLAHEVISRVISSAGFRDDLRDDALDRAVLDAFDRDAPRLAAALYLAGADQSLASLRELVRTSAVGLLKEVGSRGGAVRSESSFSTEALGTTLTGRLDLLLENPPLIVDLKLGGTSCRREELELGAAYQLAVYWRIVGTGAWKSTPAVAYYILADRRWLTTDGHAVRGVRPEKGPAPDVTWQALERAVLAEVEHLSKGLLTARGCGEADASELDAGIDEEGRLQLPSPCRYCEFGVLCGRSIEVAQ